MSLRTSSSSVSNCQWCDADRIRIGSIVKLIDSHPSPQTMRVVCHARPPQSSAASASSTRWEPVVPPPAMPPVSSGDGTLLERPDRSPTHQQAFHHRRGRQFFGHRQKRFLRQASMSQSITRAHGNAVTAKDARTIRSFLGKPILIQRKSSRRTNHDACTVALA